jgi:hypothetical protein
VATTLGGEVDVNVCVVVLLGTVLVNVKVSVVVVTALFNLVERKFSLREKYGSRRYAQERREYDMRDDVCGRRIFGRGRG